MRLIAQGSIAVVIVNWNQWKLSIRCLESLRNSIETDWHLFLVDNASTDDSRTHLSALGDDVTMIWSSVNGGWTGGNNLGVKAANIAGYEHIFILNNDAEVNPNTLSQLRSFSDGFDIPPIVGPIHLRPDDMVPDFIGATLNSRQGLPGFIIPNQIDFSALPDYYDTAFIKGAGIFANRIHFEKVGLFDERYFLNADEIDWCYRARNYGFRVLMLKDASIVHQGSSSIGGTESPLGIYFLTRNGLLFGEIHNNVWQRIRYAFALTSWLSLMGGKRNKLSRVLSLLTDRSPQFVAGRQGMLDYVLRRFGDCPAYIRTINRLT